MRESVQGEQRSITHYYRGVPPKRDPLCEVLRIRVRISASIRLCLRRVHQLPGHQ